MCREVSTGLEKKSVAETLKILSRLDNQTVVLEHSECVSFFLKKNVPSESHHHLVYSLSLFFLFFILICNFTQTLKDI